MLGAIIVGVTTYLLRTGSAIQLLGLVPFAAVFVWLAVESHLPHATFRRVLGGALFALSVVALGAAVDLRVR